MKILQVGLGNNPGGMEAFVMNYFRELARQGVSFDFVSMYGTIAYEKEILELGGRVFLCSQYKKRLLWLYKGLSEAPFPGEVRCRACEYAFSSQYRTTSPGEAGWSEKGDRTFP